MRLSEKAVLTSLNVSTWSGRKFDKKATEEVKATHGTSKDIGRFNKKLLGSAGSFDAIKKLSGEAREYHYSRTLPWNSEGARILPTACYMDYAEKMRGYKSQFETLVRVFTLDYPTLRSEARTMLNGLYRDEDYPVDIAEYFSFSVSVLPMPDADDFRIVLSADEINRVKEQVTEQVNRATGDAMRDVWGRLYTAVSKMTERLSDPEAIFRNSLTENLADLCKLLPALNLTGDATLDGLRLTVEKQLLAYDADTLRDSKSARAQVAKQAADIQALMSGYMGGV